ncbi:GNAT family N-acetyltransferase [Mycetocola tolaasinivorans]|uniref:GNAT family N-acetyltransferase n=1 Tax=Mycetocola tolaasinivorans TaxID=76635 RepID=UPI0015FF4E3D|nr:GNAT family N-acetyltransferase [Mycetocola tolaasinivorans]
MHYRRSHDPLNESISIRFAAENGSDTSAIGALLRAYLEQTEREKHAHGIGDAREHRSDTGLPQKYLPEVTDPAAAFANARILLAQRAGAAVGIVILHQRGAGDASTETEIKRLWVDPRFRGGTGRALLERALAEVTDPAVLSVWEWREGALALYRTLGFETIPSRDARAGLIWLRRPAPEDPR